jgi:predicted PurR-regulated permease PerM
MDIKDTAVSIEVIPSEGKFMQYRSLVVLAVGALAIWILSPLLEPLVMGAVFAVVLHPLFRLLGRGGMRPAKARAALVTILFLFIFVIPFGLLTITGVQKLLQLIHNGNTTLPTSFSAEGLLQWLHVPELVNKIKPFMPIEYSELSAFLMRALSSVGMVTSNLLQSILSSLPTAFVSGLVMLISVYFCLVDGPRVLVFIRENSFFDRRQTEELIHSMQLTCQSVINASLAVGLVQAVVMILMSLIAGVPNVVLIALITFMASFLPVVGTAPVPIAFAIYFLVVGSTTPALLYLVALLLVVLVDNLVRPWVIRGGANLHPLMAFVAAFGGIVALGFFGLFLGPIIVSLFFTMLPIFTRSFRRGA